MIFLEPFVSWPNPTSPTFGPFQGQSARTTRQDWCKVGWHTPAAKITIFLMSAISNSIQFRTPHHGFICFVTPVMLASLKVCNHVLMGSLYITPWAETCPSGFENAQNTVLSCSSPCPGRRWRSIISFLPAMCVLLQWFFVGHKSLDPFDQSIFLQLQKEFKL